MEFKIENHLTTEQMQEIAADEFRRLCADKFKQDSERIFSNAAYHAVMTVVDQAHDGKMVELIAAKAKDLVSSLSLGCVFARKNYWEKEDSEGYKAVNEAIKNHIPDIDAKILEIIDTIDEGEMRETLKERAIDLLDEKLFGKATA